MREKMRSRSWAGTQLSIRTRVSLEYEKEHQEHLLLSVMPAYIAAEVTKNPKKDIRAPSQVKRSWMEKMRNNSTLGTSARQFEDLFVQRHINVSILYADIVNFTPLSETLSAHQLVATLNQLFCKFDQIAQEKQCMRIKILGDCYYCVSGLPVSRPNHAINIVSMGLAMIDAIR